MRANKPELNPNETKVLLVRQKADQGIGLQPVLDGITLPLKTRVSSSGSVPGFVFEPGCQGFANG